MHMYLYTQNNYTQHTHIYYVNKKLLFWMRLIPINLCTALILMGKRLLKSCFLQQIS